MSRDLHRPMPPPRQDGRGRPRNAFGCPFVGEKGQPPAKANALAGNLPNAILGTRILALACEGRVRFPQTPGEVVAGGGIAIEIFNNYFGLLSDAR
jgi:hypothetical protein